MSDNRLFRLNSWLPNDVFVGIALLFFTLSLSDAHALQVHSDTNHLSLGLHTRYLETQDTKADISEAIGWDQESRFTQSQMETPAFGFSQSVWWFAVDLDYSGESEQEFLLEIAYPMLDHLEAYVLQANEVVGQWKVGDALAFRDRPIQYRNFVLPVVLSPRDKE